MLIRAGRSALKDGIESKDQALINNRQAGRRNRGRNNGRQNGGNRGGDNGNRIDNRARGNAPQLLEKYRNLARDAQLAGDRVNTEYYLQFADHYFRVIADNRARQDARQEDHQVRFRRNDESLDDDFDQDEMSSGESQREPFEADEASNRRNRNDRQPQRQHRYEARPVRIEAGNASDDADTPARDVAARETPVRQAPVRQPPVRQPPVRQAPAQESFGEEAEAPVEAAAPKRRGRKPREPRPDVAPEGDTQPGLDLAALPPAIARADNDSDAAEAPAPRRRGRPRRVAAEAAE